MTGARHLRRCSCAPDAHRDADLDRARPHRAHLPLHDDAGADRIGGAEALHRHREVRDHGDPVLHPRRQLPHPRRRGQADDQLRHRRWSATCTAAWRSRGVLACALFAAVSGSSPATVVAIGSILLPAMVKQGYPMKFGVGVIGTAGALGILIPPSIVMVIYAVVDQLVDRRAVHRRHHPRPPARRRC